MVKRRRAFYLLGQAQHKLSLQVDRYLMEAADITAAQAGALFFLEKNDGCSQKELSQGLGLDTSALTGMIDRLQKKDLVTKRQSLFDRRASTIHITPLAVDALSKVRPLLRSLNDMLDEEFGKEVMDTFSSVLEYLIESAPKQLAILSKQAK